VIDELMGHQRSRHGELDGGSRIGARYRHTTADMAARVVDAIQGRLMVVPQVAEEVTHVDWSRRGSGCSRQAASNPTRTVNRVRETFLSCRSRPACGRPPVGVKPLEPGWARFRVAPV
jgi:hypothetical protein